MSAATATPDIHVPATTSPYHLTFGHLLRSEWIKLRSLRSTWWTMGITVAIMVLMSLAMAASADMVADNPEMGTGPDSGFILIFGFIFAQLSVAILGALVITGEFSTGMIRSTFAAAPTRLPALWAKTITVTALTAVVALISVGCSYLVTMPILSGNDLVADLGNGTVQRLIWMLVAFLALIAILSVGLGAIIRHSTGTVFTLVALLFVVYIVMGMISLDWMRDIAKFLPMDAGMAMMNPDEPAGEVFSPFQGTLVMVGWAAVAQIGAAFSIKLRDA